MAKKADKYFKTVAKNLKKQTEDAEMAVLKSMMEDTDLYVPHDTGATRRDDTRLDKRRKSILYENEYIEYIFWGINFNFQKAKNPQAQAQWTDVSIRKNAKSWENEYADIILSAF